MNKMLGMARFAKDPSVNVTPSGSKIANFSIAINRQFKREGQPDADFFNCTAFGKTAEFIEKYMKKGTKVVFEGSVQNDNYTNKEGQKVYGTRIMINNIEFAESKAASTTDTAAATAPAAAEETSASGDSFMSIPDDVDDLPFN